MGQWTLLGSPIFLDPSGIKEDQAAVGSAPLPAEAAGPVLLLGQVSESVVVVAVKEQNPQVGETSVRVAAAETLKCTPSLVSSLPFRCPGPGPSLSRLWEHLVQMFMSGHLPGYLHRLGGPR